MINVHHPCKIITLSVCSHYSITNKRLIFGHFWTMFVHLFTFSVSHQNAMCIIEV